jgi:beta-glucanase (GH16 family)
MNKVYRVICTSAMLYCTPEDSLFDRHLGILSAAVREAHIEVESMVSWDLVWQEEFEGDALNDETWNVLDDAFGYGNRKQHYTPRNVGVSEGLLKIETKEEWSEGMPYTSGAVTTRDKVVFQQGKIEVRARMPSGQGLLPAIWLWNNQRQEFPEIDIVEILGQEPGLAWSTVHYEVGGLYGKTYSVADLEDLTADFHIYGLEWHEEKLTFLIDGNPVYTTSSFIPVEDMYLFINTGVGGDWVGNPDETTGLPKELLVDWIRYYKKIE